MNGITNDISISLGTGGPNTFDFEAPAATAGSVSTVLGNLNITNQSVETNIINNVLIQGNLNIHTTSFGYKELDMLGTQVNGCTDVNNYASRRQDAAGQQVDFRRRLVHQHHQLHVRRTERQVDQSRARDGDDTDRSSALRSTTALASMSPLSKAPARCRPMRPPD